MTKGKKRKDNTENQAPPEAPTSKKKAKKSSLKPKSKAAAAPKIVLPTFPWPAENNTKTWLLIGLLEKEDNRVLVGVRRGEKISGETKAHAINRISQVLWPEFYALDASTTASRTRSKINQLLKRYKKEAKKLKVTGGGLQTNADEDSSSGEDSDSIDEDVSAPEDNAVSGGDVRLKFYIGVNGPDEDTPEEAKNLWNAIVKRFPFFPRLHALFSALPNVNPPAITTGFGPNGRSTVYYQPPSSPKANSSTEIIDDPQVQLQYRTMHEAILSVQAARNEGPVAASDSFVEFLESFNNSPGSPRPAPGSPDWDEIEHLPETGPAPMQTVPAAVAATTVSQLIPATPISTKPVSVAAAAASLSRETLEKAKHNITPRAGRPPKFEEALLSLAESHLAASQKESEKRQKESDKRLKLEAMEAFGKRRDMIMRMQDRGRYTDERAEELLDALDEEEKQFLEN